MTDRSISALRTLRGGQDDTIFSYVGISVRGRPHDAAPVQWRTHQIHMGCIYVGCALIQDPAVIGERAKSLPGGAGPAVCPWPEAR